MSETTAHWLSDMDDRHATARLSVDTALNCDDPTPAQKLVRWMIDTKVNPYTVFTVNWLSDKMDSIEGVADVLTALENARRDDEVWFPIMANGRIYVAIVPSEDQNIFEAIKFQMRNLIGEIEGFETDYEVVGFARSADEFITRFETREAEYQAAFTEFMSTP